MALEHEPAALILSRPAIATRDRTNLAPASEVSKGAYVLKQSREGNKVKTALEEA